MHSSSKSLRQNFIITAFFLFGVFWVSTPCQAQTTDNDAVIFKVYKLIHADGDTTVNVLDSMLTDDDDVRLQFDEQTNSIFVATANETHQKIEAIITEMDVAPVESKPNVEVIDTEGRNPSNLANLLSDLTASEIGEGVRIAVDPNTGSIILSGDPEDVKTVREIMNAIVTAGDADTSIEPSTVCVVRISWLVDPTFFRETDFLQEPGSSLTELVAALGDRDWLEDGRLITSGQTVVQVKDQTNTSTGEFNTSTLRSFTENNGTSQVSFDAKGTLTSVGDDKFLLSLSMDVAGRENPITIGTTLTIPKNHPVAFSVSDVGKFKSAFVVEILDSP